MTLTPNLTGEKKKKEPKATEREILPQLLAHGPTPSCCHRVSALQGPAPLMLPPPIS